MCKTSPNTVCVSHGSQTTPLEGKGRDSQEPERPEHFLSEHQGRCSLAWERTLVLRRLGSILGRSQVRVRMCVCFYSSEPCLALLMRQLYRTWSEEEKKWGERVWGYS